MEIVIRRDYGLMMRLEPQPLKIYRNGPDSDEILDFFIDGGHHTEFELRELASAEDCVEKLTHWLECGDFPESVG